MIKFIKKIFHSSTVRTVPIRPDELKLDSELSNRDIRIINGWIKDTWNGNRAYITVFECREILPEKSDKNIFKLIEEKYFHFGWETKLVANSHIEFNKL